VIKDSLFSECELNKTDFIESIFEGAKFKRCSINNAKITADNLSKAILGTDTKGFTMCPNCGKRRVEKVGNLLYCMLCGQLTVDESDARDSKHESGDTCPKCSQGALTSNENYILQCTAFRCRATFPKEGVNDG
jgi:ribosomal protein L37AE/L43A